MFLTVKSLSINSHWFHLGRLSMIRLISGQRVWGGEMLAFHFTSAWLAVIKIYIIDNYNKYSKYNRIRCNNGGKKNKNKHLCDYGTRVDKYILRKFLPQTSEADSFFFFFNHHMVLMFINFLNQTQFHSYVILCTPVYITLMHWYVWYGLCIFVKTDSSLLNVKVILAKLHFSKRERIGIRK